MRDIITEAQQPEEAGSTRQPGLTPPPTDSMARADYPPDAVLGSYGCGIYAGHDTHGHDFGRQGSYGRGVYAGQSTYDHDYDTPGSYGRGIYAGRSTHSLDFQPRDSYDRGMEQRSDASGARPWR